MKREQRKKMQLFQSALQKIGRELDIKQILRQHQITRLLFKGLLSK
jgi:hypothetical protein